MNTTRRAALGGVGVLAMAACAPSVSPVADTSADQAAIRAAHRALQHAYYSNDIEAEMALYADDVVVMPPGVPAVSGRDAVRRLWTQDVAKPGESEVLDEKYVEVSGNVGWSSGPYRVTGVGGVEVAAGSFMATWRKSNGRWLNVQEIWNNDRPSAPVVPAK